MFAQLALPDPAVRSGRSAPLAAGERVMLLAAIAALHVIAFLLLSSSLRIVAPLLHEGELQITVFRPALPPHAAPAPPTLSFSLPAAPDVTAPNIAISPEAGSGTGASTSEIQARIAPILDPSHANERPELPGSFGALIAAASLKLRLLVLPDGSIFNAHVLRSTGEADMDRVAIQWIEGNWRYLPAVVNGRPVTAWITVIVRFAPIH